jgi:spectinomycin phosphotransferase
MQEASAISRSILTMAVQDNYDIEVADLTFLPIGADASACVYRVASKNGTHYFLKVRKGEINQASLAIPHYLQQTGVARVVAPLSTHTRNLWVELEEFKIILYPFLEGSTGVEAGMSEEQWLELGFIMQKVHATSLPTALLDIMRRESFVPKWLSVVKQFQTQLEHQTFTDPLHQQLANIWKEQNKTIQSLVESAETLGRRLKESNPPSILCHADLHTWNVLIDKQNQVQIVDWDETVLAPKERDLMFVIGGISKQLVKPENEAAFLQGYGSTSVDTLALAYYRYAWAIDDIGSFTEQMLTPGEGEANKQYALELFQKVFEPGNIVQIALESRY